MSVLSLIFNDFLTETSNDEIINFDDYDNFLRNILHNSFNKLNYDIEFYFNKYFRFFLYSQFYELIPKTNFYKKLRKAIIDDINNCSFNKIETYLSFQDASDNFLYCCLNAIDIYDLTDGKLIDLSIDLFDEELIEEVVKDYKILPINDIFESEIPY